MEIIKFSSLVITNDSSPTHFASIFNIPTITIYGPTSPSFGFYPLADNSIVIEKMSVKCRPCSIHGKNKCPQKHFECMKNINPEIVFENVKKLLKN
jgi:heptosyltransferase-2